MTEKCCCWHGVNCQDFPLSGPPSLLHGCVPYQRQCVLRGSKACFCLQSHCFPLPMPLSVCLRMTSTWFIPRSGFCWNVTLQRALHSNRPSFFTLAYCLFHLFLRVMYVFISLSALECILHASEFCSFLFPQRLEPCLAHSRCSIRIYRWTHLQITCSCDGVDSFPEWCTGMFPEPATSCTILNSAS